LEIFMTRLGSRNFVAVAPVVDRDISEVLSGEVLDVLARDLLVSTGDGGVRLSGGDGLLPKLIKAVLEKGLQAELTAHLGYEKHGSKNARIGVDSGADSAVVKVNSRNGFLPERGVITEVGDVSVAVPRDRDGSFNSRLLPKNQRRLGGLDEMIISLYAGGMTVRDIAFHLKKTMGTDISPETISTITDAVLDEVDAWQNRPLDALVVKVRENNVVSNRAAHIAIGIDTQGIKHTLGIWVQAKEGASFWASVCNNLKNRGVKDVLILCCDGLTGLPEAVSATWPFAVTQTCVVHLIRAALRYVSYKDRRGFAVELKKIYTAIDADQAETFLLELSASPLGQKYPMAVKTWEDAWEKFIPFLAFGPEVRKVIYTTNTIESLNYQLRKTIKNRGHFPNDTAVIKLLWLSIIDIEDKRTWQREKEKNTPKRRRTKPEGETKKLIEGTGTQGWINAINSLALAYPGRLPN
jgi:putative transposase